MRRKSRLYHSKLENKTGFRVQIKHQTLIFGPGKADVLSAIEEYGSLSKAAKMMAMSYGRLWSMVQMVNSEFKEPLVEMFKGGAENGGAKLTPIGKKILSTYRHATELAEIAASADIKIIAKNIRK